MEEGTFERMLPDRGGRKAPGWQEGPHIIES